MFLSHPLIMKVTKCLITLLGKDVEEDYDDDDPVDSLWSCLCCD
jgi:hypothetical protein